MAEKLFHPDTCVIHMEPTLCSCGAAFAAQYPTHPISGWRAVPDESGAAASEPAVPCCQCRGPVPSITASINCECDCHGETPVRVIDTLNIYEVSIDTAPHDDPCDCDQCRDAVQPSVWDHDFVRVGHSAHNCGVCGVHNGYHGNTGEPRGTSQSAAGAPSTDTPSPQSSGMSWTDPWPGYRMVNLALVRECDICGSLIVNQRVHDDWHTFLSE